jgi:M6 family metalloprotease-like protein
MDELKRYKCGCPSGIKPHSIRVAGIGIGLLILYCLFMPAAMAQTDNSAFRSSEEVRTANKVIRSYMDPTLKGGSYKSKGGGDLAPLVKRRALALRKLIETNPGKALELSLPQKTIQDLTAGYPELAGDLEVRGQWDGFLETIATDDFAHGRGKTSQRLYRDGKTMEVFFRTPLTAGTSCGDLVSIQGISLDGRIAAEAAAVSENIMGAGVCSKTGDQRTLVLMTYFPGVGHPWMTKQHVDNIFFDTTGGRSMNSFWQDASYGKASASGDVYGWLVLDDVYSQDDYDGIFEAVVRAADGIVDFSEYTRIFLIYPFSENTGIIGAGTVGCALRSSPGDGAFAASISWIDSNYLTDRDYGVSIVAHEGGHNLGLYHSNARDYGDQALGAPGAPGTVTEYGDYFSNMGWGGQLGHYTARQKQQLGWLSPEEILTVGDSGVYMVDPLGSDAPGVKSLKIPRGDSEIDWLWVEYRPGIGLYESQLPSAASTGALIHYEDAHNSYPSPNLDTDLLDFTPGSGSNNADFRDATLREGESWEDPYSPLSLEILDVSSTGMSIRVNRDQACVTLNPVSRTHSSGEDTGAVEIQAASWCSWTVTSAEPWIEVTSPMSGKGPATLSYRIDANTGLTRTGSIFIGQVPFTITQMYLNHPPQPQSTSPDSDSGATGEFTLVYEDPEGYQDLKIARFNVNTSDGLAGGCALEMNPVNSTLRLAGDNGTAWSSWTPFANAVSLKNSQCGVLSVRLDRSGDMGDEQTLILDLIFRSTFSGSRNLYMSASDASDAESGWQYMGAWTVVNEAPTAVYGSDDPDVGASDSFHFNVDDPNGLEDIATLSVIVNTSPSMSGGCAFRYDRRNDEFWLIDDDGIGWLGPVHPNRAQTLNNSRCGSLYFSISNQPSGLSLYVNMSYSGTFTGEKNIYLSVQEVDGRSSDWQSFGAFTVINTPPQTFVSFGHYQQEEYNLIYKDDNGIRDLGVMQVVFNDTLSFSGGCVLNYDSATDRLSLADDSGAGWLTPVPLAESYRLYNSQCQVEKAEKVSYNQTFYINVHLHFMGSFSGTKKIYSYARDLGGQNSDWVETEEVMIYPYHLPVSLSISPSRGSGYSQTFHADYFDEHGHDDLKVVHVNFIDGGTCRISYYPPSNSIEIAYTVSGDSAGGILGSAGVLQAGPCAVDADASTATGDGTYLTLNLEMIFDEDWNGEKTITLFSTDMGEITYYSTQYRGMWRVGAPTPDDFNSDGRADLLWRDEANGNIYVRYMNRDTGTPDDYLGTVPDMSWRIVVEADFNHDGNPDIVWHDETTGKNMLWYMEGVIHVGSVSLPPAPDGNWRIAGVSDFNGDGETDILWRNRLTGKNTVWYMDGVTQTGSSATPAVSDASWRIAGIADFNGDGCADIVWRNAETGKNAVWYMEGTLLTGSAPLPDVSDTDWEIVRVLDFNGDGYPDILWHNAITYQNRIWYMDGTAISDTVVLASESPDWLLFDARQEPTGPADRDFNRDGKPDILWRNDTSGKNTVWYMDGVTKTGSASLSAVSDVGWKIVGTADFNGDGKPDILWRNTATGKNAVWTMDGITKTGSVSLSTVTDVGWKIVGTADFNGDSKPDILWRNDTSGKNTVWYMNGTAKTGSASLPSVSDVNWKIVGAADFNDDGKPDILWRNTVSGKNAVWYMDGAATTGSASLPSISDITWKIVDAADFNGDWKPDILWRNMATGKNAVWYMDGVATTGSASISTVSDTNWVIAPQR